jgi:hypothetical protein
MALHQLRCLRAFRGEFGDQMHRHRGASEHGIAAGHSRIADEATGPAQFTQRRDQGASRFPEIDLQETALERDNISQGFGQSIGDLAPELGRDAIRQPPLSESETRTRVSSRPKRMSLSRTPNPA